jgi:hypothetical protein
MPWYKVAMSNDDVMSMKHMSLQMEFADLWDTNRHPRDAAMFDEHSGIKHEFYFSPGAVRIAKALISRYRGLECPPPQASDVVLLVGDQSLALIPFSS